MRRLLLPREWGPLRYSELWLEGDELLYVHSSRFSDKYSRYRIADIQAFVLTEFPLWNTWRVYWLGGSAFFTALLLVVPPRWWKLFALLPGFFLVWAIFYLARGPRCRLVLHTAVSTVTLEAVRTMAQARVAMPQLRQLTEGAQGRLAPDGITVTEMPQVVEPPPAPQNTPLLLHVLFGVLVLHAVVLAGFYFGNKMDTGLGVSGMLLLTEVVLGAIAALRWRVIGAAMTVACVAVTLLAIADGGFYIYAAVETMGGFVKAVSGRRAAGLEDLEWLWLKEQTVGRAAWHAVAGLAGWILLGFTRGRRA